MLMSRSVSRVTRGLIRRAHIVLFDRPFDRRMQVDTFDPGVRPPAEGPNWHPRNYRYVSSPVQAFRHAVTSLPIDLKEFVFIDLGSGRGRTLLIAATLHF